MAICGCIVSWANWQRWVFKPLTLLLLLLLAWQRRCSTPLAIWCWQGCAPHCGRCANPVATSTSDVRHRRVFLSHLLYTIYFASQMTLSFFCLCHWCCWFWARCYWRLSGRAGRVSLAYLHVYRHDAGDGVLAGELWFFRPTAPALSAFVALHCCLSVTLSGWVATIAAAPGR